MTTSPWTNTPAARHLVTQGSALHEGHWLPWHTISALVYENRIRWPRANYKVRIVVLPASNADSAGKTGK